MSSEERRAWVYVLVTIVTYAIYIAIILGQAAGRSIAEVPYVSTMLWVIGWSIVASIVLNIVLSIFVTRGADKKDRRDREIGRFGEYVGHAFVIAGAVVALLLAMAESDYFWIANVIYLGFVLSAVVGSIVKLVAYRRGLPTW